MPSQSVARKNMKRSKLRKRTSRRTRINKRQNTKRRRLNKRQNTKRTRINKRQNTKRRRLTKKYIGGVEGKLSDIMINKANKVSTYHTKDRTLVFKLYVPTINHKIIKVREGEYKLVKGGTPRNIFEKFYTLKLTIPLPRYIVDDRTYKMPVQIVKKILRREIKFSVEANATMDLPQNEWLGLKVDIDADKFNIDDRLVDMDEFYS